MVLQPISCTREEILEFTQERLIPCFIRSFDAWGIGLSNPQAVNELPSWY